MENPNSGTYSDAAYRSIRGGGLDSDSIYLSASVRYPYIPSSEINYFGFRVASKFPENWCMNPPAGDLNGDCITDLIDLGLFVVSWMDCGLNERCP